MIYCRICGRVLGHRNDVGDVLTCSDDCAEALVKRNELHAFLKTATR